MKLEIVLITTILAQTSLFKRFAHATYVPSLHPVCTQFVPSLSRDNIQVILIFRRIKSNGRNSLRLRHPNLRKHISLGSFRIVSIFGSQAPSLRFDVYFVIVCALRVIGMVMRRSVAENPSDMLYWPAETCHTSEVTSK